MTDYSIFTAMRRQVYRVVASGITGAGSPGARYALPEAVASLTSLKRTFLTYQPRLTGRAPALAAWTEKSFELSLACLRQEEGFSRDDFTTSYANVLSSALADAQQALAITAPAGRLALFFGKEGEFVSNCETVFEEQLPRGLLALHQAEVPRAALGDKATCLRTAPCRSNTAFRFNAWCR
jgi:hypothetical protein